MDLNKLRTFVRVVEAGSISLAASRCFRTQQAVSLQIKLLEQDLEVPLFHRAGARLQLTKEGELLYRRSKEHLLGLETSCRDIKSKKKEPRGTVTFGLWSEQSTCPFPGIITEFRQKFPGVDVKIVMGTNAKLEDLLTQGKVDFAIVVCLQNPELFHRRLLVIQELVPVASRKYLATTKPITSIADTLDHDILDYSIECPSYQRWIEDNAPELLPLAQKKHFVVTVDSDVVLKKLVLNDNGIAFLPRSLMEDEIASGEATELLLQRSRPAAINVEIVHKKAGALPYLQEQFFNFVVGEN